MVKFLSIIFVSWISSIFVGFFKSSSFFVSLSISYAQVQLKRVLYTVYITIHIYIFVYLVHLFVFSYFGLSNRLHSVPRWKFSERTEKLSPPMNKSKLK